MRLRYFRFDLLRQRWPRFWKFPNQIKKIGWKMSPNLELVSLLSSYQCCELQNTQSFKTEIFRNRQCITVDVDGFQFSTKYCRGEFVIQVRILISWPVLEFEKSARVIVTWNLHRLHLDPIAVQKMSDPNVTKTKVSLCIVFPLFALKETNYKFVVVDNVVNGFLSGFPLFLTWTGCERVIWDSQMRQFDPIIRDPIKQNPLNIK